ncbi:DUF4913 domain-containing protein [Arthrobacter sp. YAF34]|uniref:DUF4913 domain-containing protein n=1 Tax=Arthrobacter sp. YAF34 TaxID=3233083 RepID=UPI003F92303B
MGERLSRHFQQGLSPPRSTFSTEALWPAWEHRRLGVATGSSGWVQDHAYHYKSVLLDPRGAF